MLIAFKGFFPLQKLDQSILNNVVCVVENGALLAIHTVRVAYDAEEWSLTVILDLETGLLTAANAGHEYPVLKAPNGRFEIVQDKHGFVIGGMPGVKYHEYELQLEPGSKLFVYTDGVAEATNSSQQLFGTERMIAALNKAANAAPAAVLQAVNLDVAAFVGQAPQFDDLTMLCIEYKGKTNDNKESQQ